MVCQQCSDTMAKSCEQMNWWEHHTNTQRWRVFREHRCLVGWFDWHRWRHWCMMHWTLHALGQLMRLGLGPAWALLWRCCNIWSLCTHIWLTSVAHVVGKAWSSGPCIITLFYFIFWGKQMKCIEGTKWAPTHQSFEVRPYFARTPKNTNKFLLCTSNSYLKWVL
jgi:hypothetical protein